MATLNIKVKKYIEANSKTWDSEKNNIVLQNDGSGDYIKSWNVSGLSEPTAEQIASYETAALQLQADYDAKQYQRDRVYPSIGDQLDMLWHSIDQNPALKSQYFDFYEAIKAVKVKFPKNG